MKMNIKKLQKIGNKLPIKWVTGFILLISICLYVYERSWNLGFHAPDIPLTFFIIIWLYVILLLIALLITPKRQTILKWIILNVSSLGILLLFLSIFIINRFYLSYYFVHFHLPVLSIMSVITLFKNNDLKKDIKSKHKLDYLISVGIPLLVTSIFLITCEYISII